jgi:hypothetical protein
MTHNKAGSCGSAVAVAIATRQHLLGLCWKVATGGAVVAAAIDRSSKMTKVPDMPGLLQTHQRVLSKWLEPSTLSPRDQI